LDGNPARISQRDRLRCHRLLWKRTQASLHLLKAHALLEERLADAPVESRSARVETLPLQRAIADTFHARLG